jgi:ferric-dicitrate binding protein FerR (iron transport regulator)
MENPDFGRILRRYLNGECTAEEKRLIEKWFERIADPSLHLNDSEKEKISQKLLHNLQRATGIKTNVREVRFNSVWKVGIAAAITFIGVGMIWMFSQRQGRSGAENNLSVALKEVLHENKNLVPEKVRLSDGSTILLQPGSNIRYQQDFNTNKREIKLEGDAFFDVVKNVERPFYVYANNVVTRVLGTSFYVKSPLGKNTIEVEVKTGRVHVYKDQKIDSAPQKPSESEGVILTPNEKVIYFTEKNQWITTLVEKPTPTKDGKAEAPLLFDNTPVHEIAKRLEEEYGIDIIIENKKVKSCTFTGDVTALPLYDILSVIVKSIGGSYEIQETNIVIHGKGCDDEE